MTIEEILQLQPKEMLDILLKRQKAKDGIDIDANYDLFNGRHKILDKLDKTVGKDETRKSVKTNKIVVKFQEKIVRSSTLFTFGAPVRLVDVSEKKNDALFKTMSAVLKKNKAEFFNRTLGRTVLIETEAAELWYAKPAAGVEDGGVPGKADPVGRIRVKLLTNKNGDGLFPHYDIYGDMDAFTRTYIVTGADGKPQNMATVYTAAKVTTFKKETGGDWTLAEKGITDNPFGKIPIIYYAKDEPDWSNVQGLIDRFEELISYHGDQNDYFSGPLLKSKGDIKTLPDKYESGKVIRIGAEEKSDGSLEWGDVEYLTWDQSPESLKLELENLKELIFSLSDTPDLSFKNLQGLGDVTGVALQTMFWGAILKSYELQEVFGAGLDRRNNLLKTIIGSLEGGGPEKYAAAEFENQFTTVLPQNLTEVVRMLSDARGGDKIISRETSMKHNPLVADPAREEELLAAEDAANAQATVNELLGGLGQ